MKTKEQNISMNTLLAASIGCFIQLALWIFVVVSPFLLINVISSIYGRESAGRILVYLSTPFTKDPKKLQSTNVVNYLPHQFISVDLFQNQYFRIFSNPWIYRFRYRINV